MNWARNANLAKERREIRSLLEHRGLRLTSFILPNIEIDIASTRPEMRAYSLNLLSETVRQAGELDARGVVISPGKANPLFPSGSDGLRGYFFAALDPLRPIAKASGVTMWIENVPLTCAPIVAGLMELLSRYGDEAVRIVYDIATAYFIGEDFVEGLKTCRERLELVHLSDTGQKVFRHDPVGEGTLPFAEVPVALTAVTYNARPMPENISPTPDIGITASTPKLAALDFARAYQI